MSTVAAFPRPQGDVAAVTIEQAVLARCFVDPANVDALAAVASPSDFADPFHARLAETMIAMRGDGRVPSTVAVIAAFEDGEIAPGLRVSTYLRRLVGAVFGDIGMPFAAALDALVSEARRRDLSEIGSLMQAAAASGSVPLRNIALDAGDRINGVLAGLGASKSTRYSGHDAAGAAIAHLDANTPHYPTTGFTDLDRLLGGWPRAQMTVIAGRPGMGKSAIATSTLQRCARAGHSCLFFSLEMMSEQLGARLLTDLAYASHDPIAYEDILHRRIDPRQRERLEAAKRMLADLPIQIEEQRGLTIADIVTRSRKAAELQARAGRQLEVIFVDHMLLVRASQRYAGNRVREVAEISDGLATLAKDLDVSVVALCQLNRGVEGRENKRPGMADLRDSGSIEEDASAIVFAYRPAYYLERERFDNTTAELERQQMLDKCRHQLELNVAKNRNGRIGPVNCFVDIGANAIRNGEFGGRR